MQHRTSDEDRAKTLRDMAVLAVARRGALERSGNANMAVLKQEDLMIGYHTPFNPLPKLADSAKYDAALEGREPARDAYGIDIWLDDAGKVFSAGWASNGEMHVRLYKPGPWQTKLEEIAAPKKSGKKTAAPQAPNKQQLRVLEQENKRLRRAISGLMLDKLILVKAAAGKL